MMAGTLASSGDAEAFAALKVFRTTSALERMRGLLFRKPLVKNEALWIQPCNSIHTLLMSYSIDAVFVDGSGSVLKVVGNLPPWRFSG